MLKLLKKKVFFCTCLNYSILDILLYSVYYLDWLNCADKWIVWVLHGRENLSLVEDVLWLLQHTFLRKLITGTNTSLYLYLSMSNGKPFKQTTTKVVLLLSDWCRTNGYGVFLHFWGRITDSLLPGGRLTPKDTDENVSCCDIADKARWYNAATVKIMKSLSN